MQIAGMADNRGRNLQRIADLAPGGATVAVIVTSDPEAPVVAAADERGIPVEVVEPEDDRQAHEERLLDRLADYEFDLVALDGYMRVLTETFLDRVPVTLNVHPSLLPAFQGLNAHEQTLEAGVRVSGATVHVVTESVDDGPIVTQEAVPVYPDDDPATLKRRVLEEAEFAAYPRAIRAFATEQATVADGEVRIEGDLAGQSFGRATLAAEDDGRFPSRRLASGERVRELRYGENPHQSAALYRDPTATAPTVVDADQLNSTAKALSYNNYNDADAAVELVAEFDEPAAAVIKHTNPAGCATADTLADAYADALATDAKSAFGGIVACNREVDEQTATLIADSFKEVVAAPSYTPAARETLTAKDNLRVLSLGALDAYEQTPGSTADLTDVSLTGGRLVQQRDRQAPTAADLEVVTEREPTDAELETALFAWRVMKHVKSNGILFASGTETVGVGMGQVSRVDAVTLAAMKAEKDADGKSAEGAVMASDAFFPFPDAIEEAAAAGIEAVIQPGGSVNDQDVIDACDDRDMAMVFTGSRAFRHD